MTIQPNSNSVYHANKKIRNIIVSVCNAFLYSAHVLFVLSNFMKVFLPANCNTTFPPSTKFLSLPYLWTSSSPISSRRNHNFLFRLSSSPFPWRFSSPPIASRRPHHPPTFCRLYWPSVPKVLKPP